MKLQLVFDSWRDKDGKEVSDEKRIELEMGSFHGGTCFDAMLDLASDDIIDLEAASREGFSAIFYVATDTVNDGAARLAFHMETQRKQQNLVIEELKRQTAALETEREELRENISRIIAHHEGRER